MLLLFSLENMKDRLAEAVETYRVAEEFAEILKQPESIINDYFIALKLESWVPEPAIKRAKKILGDLVFRYGFSEIQLDDFMTAEASDCLITPAIVIDTTEFTQDINELAHLRHAVSCGQEKGLLILGGGKQASHGVKFKPQRKKRFTSRYNKIH